MDSNEGRNTQVISPTVVYKAEEARQVGRFSKGLFYEMLRQGLVPGAIRTGRVWRIGVRPFHTWLEGEDARREAPTPSGT